MQLHITSYGAYVHVRDQMFEIRVKTDGEEKKHLYSAKKVRTILMGQKCALSTDAVKLAITNNVDILFIEYDGRPLGRIWHSKLGSTSRIRKEQLRASIAVEGATAARKWVMEKNDGQINLLKKLKKHREKHAEYIQDKIGRLESLNISINNLEFNIITDIADTLRGLEGTSGRLFFETLSYLLPKEHTFSGRSSRPATDPFNAFLNYAFGMLYGKIEKSLIIAGLDPYLGYMHRDDYNQLSFVFDFIEPYRIYATEVVFKLFSAKKVSKVHTDKITNGLSLNKAGKELLVGKFNEFMEEETIRYRGRNQTRSNAIQFDAHSYANSLIKSNSTEDVTDIDKMFEL